MNTLSRQQNVPSLLSKVNAPVIVTFDGAEKVVDTFGELEYYCEPGSGLIDILSSILVGWNERIDTLPEVEMPSGRYASIRIVPEGDLKHVVLTDVTYSVLEQRGLLQASHEAALAKHWEKVGLERELRRRTINGEPADAQVAEAMLWDIRARANEILGYAHVVEGLSTSRPLTHAVSCIKRSAFHLHALSLACANRVEEASPFGADRVESVNIRELLEEIGDQAGRSSLAGKIEIDVKAASGTGVAAISYEGSRHALICLLSCVIEMRDDAVRIDAIVSEDEVVVEFSVPLPAEGLDAGYLVEQLKRDIRSDAAFSLIRSMGGSVATVEHAGAFGLRVAIPAGRLDTADSFGVHRGTVLVAIDEQVMRERVLVQLAALGIPATCCKNIDELETAALDGGANLIVIGGSLADAGGVGSIYRMHGKGLRARVLVIKASRVAPAAWVFDGRRTLVSIDADDDFLRSAIEGALSA